MAPEDVLKCFSSRLIAYELEECKHHDTIYFLGEASAKREADLDNRTNNYGYATVSRNHRPCFACFTSTRPWESVLVTGQDAVEELYSSKRNSEENC